MDLSETTARSHLSAAHFDIVCYIGILVIDEASCAKISLKLDEKLLAAKIYEHFGPAMGQARRTVGKGADPEFMEHSAAIGLLGGPTWKMRILILYISKPFSCRPLNRKNAEFTVQELVRMDRAHWIVSLDMRHYFGTVRLLPADLPSCNYTGYKPATSSQPIAIQKSYAPGTRSLQLYPAEAV